VRRLSSFKDSVVRQFLQVDRGTTTSTIVKVNVGEEVFDVALMCLSCFCSACCRFANKGQTGTPLFTSAPGGVSAECRMRVRMRVLSIVVVASDFDLLARLKCKNPRKESDFGEIRW
jgi:hypothetical protein